MFHLLHPWLLSGLWGRKWTKVCVFYWQSLQHSWCSMVFWTPWFTAYETGKYAVLCLNYFTKHFINPTMTGTHKLSNTSGLIILSSVIWMTDGKLCSEGFFRFGFVLSKYIRRILLVISYYEYLKRWNFQERLPPVTEQFSTQCTVGSQHQRPEHFKITRLVSKLFTYDRSYFS